MCRDGYRKIGQKQGKTTTLAREFGKSVHKPSREEFGLYLSLIGQSQPSKNNQLSEVTLGLTLQR